MAAPHHPVCTFAETQPEEELLGKEGEGGSAARSTVMPPWWKDAWWIFRSVFVHLCVYLSVRILSEFICL